MTERKTATHRYRVETLEPRLLLAADWLGGLAPAWTADADAHSSGSDLADYLTDSPEPEFRAGVPPFLPDAMDLTALLGLQSQHDAAPGSMRHELVIIDAGIEGYEDLVAGVELRGGVGVQYEVFVLSADTDGIRALSGILADYSNLDAVHIVSHGGDAALQLGGARLDASSIGSYAEAIRGWSAALADDADLLIYGCNLAASEPGQALVGALGELTQADIAASSDLTGQALLGGDWDLEYRAGVIETTTAFSMQLQGGWSGVLGTFIVNTLDDTVDANPGDGFALDSAGNTSLRAAIMEANALGGQDTIELPSGTYVLQIAGEFEDAAATGDLDFREDITIVGADAANTIIDAADIDRVFDVIGTSTVALSGLTIQGGDSASNGGGIQNVTGTLILKSVTIRDNSAGANGGGIYNQGDLTLDSATISGNDAGSRGGGLVSEAGATNVTLSNVTISGNTTGSRGGGLSLNSDASLLNVTITGNTAGSQGGGIQVAAGTVTLQNSIVAGNSAATAGPDVDGTVVSDGSNMILNGAGSSGFAVGELGVDPLLDPVLRDNGGPTLTHAVLAGSPAIDAPASGAAPNADQRGYARDGTPDIGAFEFGAAANSAPVANDDSYTVTSDTPLVVDAASGPLANDTDPDLDALTLYLLGQPLNGTLTLNPVGLAALLNLSTDLGIDTFPDWSPDGTKIVFASDRDGDFDIYVINADGTGLMQLTSAGASDRQPVWSPDGTKILYRSDADGTFDIYVMDADGSNPVRLTTGAAADGADELDASWSPDGSRIVYVMDLGNRSIYVMDADGSNPQALTTPAARDIAPAWSPDGTRIAFVSDRDGSDEIYLMDADGTNVTRLTTNGAIEGAPAWSPDGSKILFHSDIDGDDELFVMDADGSNVVQLTDNTDVDRRPVWSPDGTHIAFQTDRDGNYEIYVASIASDGGFSYTPDTGFTGVDSFTYRSTDGIDESDPATVTLIVTGGVDTVVESPTDSTTEDTDLVFSAATGNAITVDDGTSDDTVLRTTLTVTSGVLNLATTAGLMSVTGDGTTTVVVIGVESAINAALDGLTYSPTADYYGSATLQVTTDLQANLLGFYDFSQANPLGTDSSPAGGNDGAPSGPGSLPDPYADYDFDHDSDVLFLDGIDDNITIPGRFGTPTSVTLAAWVNVAAINNQEVISIGNSIVLRLNDDNNGDGVTGFYHDGTGWNHTDSGQFIGGDGWHHVAFTFDDANDKQIIYIDGVALGTTSHTGSINWAHLLNTTIGSHADGAGYWLDGMLDDARIYDRALSAGEIQALASGQFSDTEIISITIDPQNDAPVLGDNAPALSDIAEDDLTSAGDAVADIVIDGAITDPDGAAVESIAIVSVDDSNGTWQYSTDNGATWSAVDDGALGAGHALLLDGTLTGSATQRLRFVPDADFNGSPTFTFRAWDMSGGISGNYADTTMAGGTSPYSSATDSAVINVTAVNDAPLVDLNGPDGSGNDYSTAYIEDDPPVTVADVDATIGDPDDTTYNSLTVTLSGALNGMEERIRFGGEEFKATETKTKVVTVGSTDFQIDYDGTNFVVTLDGGGVMSETDLLSLIRSITYENQDNNSLDGIRSFTFVLQDAAGTDSSASTATINVSSINDAPTLTTFAGVVETTNEDTEVEISFADLSAQGDQADVDGSVNAFVVRNVLSGTLRIGTSAATATPWAAGTNDTIDASNNAYWTPGPDSNGVQNAFEVVAQDNDGLQSASNVTAQVSVIAVNDAPSFSTLGNQSVTEDSGPHTVAGFATALPGGGPDESGQGFSYNISSDNPGLFLVGPAIDASGTLTYTLNPNANGSARITVSVTDTGGTANGGVDTSADQTFDIVVGAVNDAPSFSTLGDQSVLEDSGSHTVAGFATALPGGGPDESGQGFSYNVSSDNPGLFLVGPAIDASGTLTYTLNPNANGSARITVSVTDTGGTANGGVDTSADQTFDIVVGAVNDAPSFSTLGDQSVLEDSGSHTVAGFATALPGGGPDESGQGFSYNVSSDNPGLFLVGPAIDASGTLTYTLNPNANGSARITVSVTDTGGTANGGVDTSGDQTFDIFVTPGGDDLVATNLDQTLLYLEDSGPVALQDILVTVGGSSGLVSATLTLSDPATGSLSADSGNGESYSSELGAWTVTGTVSQVNAALAAVAFIPAPNNDAGSTVVTHIENAAGQGPADGLIMLGVTPVNDAPSGADGLVTFDGDTVYVFTMANFGFSDPIEGHAALAVEFTALPGWAGTLTNNGQPLAAGDVVSATDIDAGYLQFVPARGFAFDMFASLAFRVQDAGGTANGGIDIDPDENRLSLVIRHVPDAALAQTSGSGTDADDSDRLPDGSSVSDDIADDDTGKSESDEALVKLPADDNLARPTPVEIPAIPVADVAMPAPTNVPLFRAVASYFDTADVEKAVAEPRGPEIPARVVDKASHELSPSADDIFLGLAQMRNAVDQDIATDQFTLESATAAALGLSVGYVSWLLRGGVLLSSLLSSLPVWRFIDPLPVFARERDRQSDEVGDESLEAIVKSGGAKPDGSVSDADAETPQKPPLADSAN